LGNLLKALEFSHKVVARVIKPGDRVVDATAGNGHDTLFLAKMVGEKGKVFVFDIQKQAISNTRELLLKNDLLERVQLFNDNHGKIVNYLSEEVSTVMFNLGYLPGSNKEIITRPETTIEALKGALNLLSLKGVITIVVYTGHPGGEEEWLNLEKFLLSLNSNDFSVLIYKYINQRQAPFLIAIEKMKY